MSESETPGSPQPPAKDPLTSFRGVLAGALILQVIVVALALLVVQNLGAGIGSGQGWLLLAVVVCLLACCGLLRFRWVTLVVFVLQLVLVAFVVTLPAVGFIGVLFLGVWIYMLWLRRDVARRMREGSLPSQQEDG